MSSTLKSILTSLTLFLFICFLGFFSAWIGGVKPFTDGAGLASCMTIFVAGMVSITNFLFRD